LRKLLQAVISHIPNEKDTTWKNAEVKFFDEECEEYVLLAGDGRNQFAVFTGKEGDPKVMKLKDHSSRCFIL